MKTQKNRIRRRLAKLGLKLWLPRKEICLYGTHASRAIVCRGSTCVDGFDSLDELESEWDRIAIRCS